MNTHLVKRRRKFERLRGFQRGYWKDDESDVSESSGARE